MAGNSFGKLFRVTTFGESHGAAMGCVVDGCPAGLPLSQADIHGELLKRRPGGGDGAASGAASGRNEADTPEILSGVFDGVTLGTPIAVVIRNTDARPGDYDHLKDVYRGGHADWTWEAKFGIRDHRGGGRSSGRETVGRVAAGAVAKIFLARHGIAVRGWVSSIFGVTLPLPGESGFDLNEAGKNPLRVPCSVESSVTDHLLAKIEGLRAEGDSCGGIVSCSVTGLPPGLGEPVFDKLDAVLAAAMLSIGGCKGVEFGAGFAAAAFTGSQNNDEPVPGGGHPPAPGVPAVGFKTNNCGGVLGGISSGQELFFKAAFKPPASIAKPQKTVDKTGCPREVSAGGRHDVCIAPRAVAVVEAMAALVLADFLLGRLKHCSFGACNA